MQLQKVKAAFERKGYTPNSYIDKKQYFKLLNSLMPNGAEFHEEVADQLWAQAAGQRPSKQLRVLQVCSTIVDAQSILRQRIYQTGQQIGALEMQKKKLQSNMNKQSVRRIQQIQQKLDQLYGQKQSFEDDYRLVTQPFGIQTSIMSGYRPTTAAAGAQSHYSQRNSYYDPQNPLKNTDHTQSEQLRSMFYLTLTFGFLEIIMIYGKPDFLNVNYVIIQLIALTCLLSIYLMNFFDKAYIRLTLALIVASIALDIVWLIVYASIKWNPSEVSNNSVYQIGYMRFIVFFTIVLIPLKTGLLVHLFKYRNADAQDKYTVSIGLMKIFLSANKINPISKGLLDNPILSQ